MDETPVLVDRRPDFWVLTLNRPQRLNSFTQAMHVALMKALDEAEAQGCRALLITGAGRGFCAGQDLSDPIAKGDLGDTIERYYNPLLRKLRNLPFPTVAGVNGVAAGAGANIAFACDIVLAAKSANFTQAFAKIGLVPDSGGTWLLPRLAGSARARGLALLAEPLSAEKAESWGLIWKAVDDDKLIAEAEKICTQFGSGPTFGLAQIKRALDAAETNDFATQLDLERDLQRAAGRSPDYAEGVKAFMEKRAPVFTGRER
ncbi:2-(1,2-epoxy-1,2-dihydrophenyl)acetyl-CoA isomerase [Pseudolabrys taiwanensis]|uniref:2-(1,2-epoxy-1,2-dihydrophenyl)acetyl-CoA isomerase n=1 Tax=Pseudolabrys taiwanensis TaxID=331696 RepID=A0A346A3C1_9HYPH|nr:2-(1,2-epoxy-1,2-dihydrophenyl)acetyl-CoA isomerase PaaG [Pseudolabrys taiwanensis]AXK83668.1 2-(1,2-epoxy-1,2-dihydrophenyl)acetyl-CoA isomerase [Pseudolabrys taiwanensis]